MEPLNSSRSYTVTNSFRRVGVWSSLILALLLPCLAPGAEPPADSTGLTTLFLSRGFSQGYVIRFGEAAYAQRVTPELNLAWGDKTGKKLTDFFPDLKTLYFLNIRWIGSIVPPATGPYVLRAHSRPPMRLMVDGKVLVDAMYGRGGIDYDTTVELTAGKPVEVVVEYWNWADGSIQLLWRVPGTKDFAIVPSACLRADSPATQPSAPLIPAPIAAPAGGSLERSSFIALSGPADTYIRYTLDGSEPTRQHGTLYTVPVALTTSTTLKARAIAARGGQSTVSTATYTIPALPPAEGLKIFRTGNSLTINAMAYESRILQQGAVSDSVHPIILAGAPTRLLWEKFGGEKVSDPKRFARAIVKEHAPLNCYITQPFAENDLKREVEFTSNFYDLVLAHSPKADLVIYMQWAEWRDPSERPPGMIKQPAEWEQNMQSYIAWFEALRDALQAKYPNQRVWIIPGAIGFQKLQKAIDQGKIPGLKSFANEIMGDSLHAGQKGCYFIGLLHYAALHHKSPVGMVVPDTELTPEQQKAFQEIAWETVSQYPHSPR